MHTVEKMELRDPPDVTKTEVSMPPQKGLMSSEDFFQKKNISSYNLLTNESSI